VTLVSESCSEYLLMEFDGGTEPLHYAERRLGRRTALILPLLSPPQ